MDTTGARRGHPNPARAGHHPASGPRARRPRAPAASLTAVDDPGGPARPRPDRPLRPPRRRRRARPRRTPCGRAWGTEPGAGQLEHPRIGLAEAEVVRADQQRQPLGEAEPLELGHGQAVRGVAQRADRRLRRRPARRATAARRRAAARRRGRPCRRPRPTRASWASSRSGPPKVRCRSATRRWRCSSTEISPRVYVRKWPPTSATQRRATSSCRDDGKVAEPGGATPQRWPRRTRGGCRSGCRRCPAGRRRPAAGPTRSRVLRRPSGGAEVSGQRLHAGQGRGAAEQLHRLEQGRGDAAPGHGHP